MPSAGTQKALTIDQLFLVGNWKGTIPRGNDPQDGLQKVVCFREDKNVSLKCTEKKKKKKQNHSSRRPPNSYAILTQVIMF